jgi:hypothetical protein
MSEGNGVTTEVLTEGSGRGRSDALLERDRELEEIDC